MKKIPWYYEISPDGFSRYFLIKEILKKIFGNKKGINILDVGGKENSLWAMIKDEKLPYELTVIDILQPDETTKNYRYIQANATKMVFKNSSFDAVISTDTLEHIPDPKKEKLISECLRVAKDLVIFAAPFDSKETSHVEQLANDYFKELTGQDHPWLKEHFEYKRPKKELVENFLKKKELPYLYFEYGNFQNWVMMILQHFLSVKIGTEPPEIKILNQYFNMNLLEMGEFTVPAYRQYYVIFKNKDKLLRDLNYLTKHKFNIFKKTYWESESLKFLINEIFRNRSGEDQSSQIKLLQANIQILGSILLEYDKKFTLAQQHSKNLEEILRTIEQAKTFKLWQGFVKLKKNFFKKTEEENNNGSTNKQTDRHFDKKYSMNDLELEIQRKESIAFGNRHKFTIIMITENTSGELLKHSINSVLNQTYENWELNIIDNGSTNKRTINIIKEYESRDRRIRATFLTKGKDSYEAAKIGLELSTGEFVSFLWNTDVLWPNALFEVSLVLRDGSNINLIYSDEDKINIDESEHFDPFFKPDFSEDLLLSYNYIGNFVCYRKDFLESIKGIRKKYWGNKNYDLVLRITQATDKIFHVPKILYSEKWRNRDKGERNSLYSVNKKILLDFLKTKKTAAKIIPGVFPNSQYIIFSLEKTPLVSIIIPTKDNVKFLEKAVNGVLNQPYKNLEILIINNNSHEEQTFSYFKTLKKNGKIRVFDFNMPFNISAIFNFAVGKSNGEYILLLNNDIEPITKDWLTGMVRQIQKKGVGGVGVKLLYPDKKTIQHAGVLLGIKNKNDEHGVAGHPFKGMQDKNPNDFPRYFLKDIVRNWSAVTGACFITKKDLYQKVGGFNEKNLKILFSDVDYCLKLRKEGYSIIYDPNIVMIHHESISVGKAGSGRIVDINEIDYMRSTWNTIIDNDPFYNPNLSLIGESFSIETENIVVQRNNIKNPQTPFFLVNKVINILKREGVKGLFKKIINKHESNNIIDSYNKDYGQWIKEVEEPHLEKVKQEIRKVKINPKISILIPTFNSRVDLLEKTIQSVKNQWFENWEICIVDDGSTHEDVLNYLSSIRNGQIKINLRKVNMGIGQTTNEALALASGDYFALLDHDDELTPNALTEAVMLLEKHPDTDMIYSDEDKLDQDGKRVEPFFKPSWSPDYFLSSMYTTHLGIYRTKLARAIGGFRKGFDGSQDYDFTLRFTEKTKNIQHISQILYHWRKIHGSTASVYSAKSYARTSTQKALLDTIERRSLNASLEDGLQPDLFRVKYKIENMPLVSIIIPTKNKKINLEKCINSIFSKTIYENYEILIVDNGSDEEETLNYLNIIKKNPKIRVIKYNQPFNFAAINNFAVERSKGEYLVLLNNDTEVITSDWIESMLEHAQRPEIGAVGAKLLYPDGHIQHAGVILGIGGIAGHAQKYFLDNEPGRQSIFNSKDVIKNYSAVTAACLMINKRKFLEVGGFDERFTIAFNDVDFCLKLRSKGYYNLYTPYAKLFHYESLSTGKPGSEHRNMKQFRKEIELMGRKWGKVLQNDPFYNKNLSLTREDFSIRVLK